MKKFSVLSTMLICALFLTACFGITEPGISQPPTPVQPTDPIPTSEPITEAPETVPTQPLHSPLYIEDIAVEDVILYFNEVCLDSEFINSGDPSFVQKWTSPILYSLDGNYTEEDLITLNLFAMWLNSMEGFPGISPCENPDDANLQIYFCEQSEMVNRMGSNFQNMDGAVTFYYNGNNEIYDAIICYRTDIEQETRNSVILEEIYNGLGPIQDTVLRQDSIIYSEFSDPQWLSPMDELILRLLYHPDIQPGMDAQQCEQIIRQLYY